MVAVTTTATRQALGLSFRRMLQEIKGLAKDVFCKILVCTIVYQISTDVLEAYIKIEVSHALPPV